MTTVISLKWTRNGGISNPGLFQTWKKFRFGQTNYFLRIVTAVWNPGLKPDFFQVWNPGLALCETWFEPGKMAVSQTQEPGTILKTLSVLRCRTRLQLSNIKQSWAKLSKAGQSWAKLSEAERSWAKLSEAERSWGKLRKTEQLLTSIVLSNAQQYSIMLINALNTKKIWGASEKSSF